MRRRRSHLQKNVCLAKTNLHTMEAGSVVESCAGVASASRGSQNSNRMGPFEEPQRSGDASYVVVALLRSPEEQLSADAERQKWKPQKIANSHSLLQQR